MWPMWVALHRNNLYCGKRYTKVWGVVHVSAMHLNFRDSGTKNGSLRCCVIVVYIRPNPEEDNDILKGIL